MKIAVSSSSFAAALRGGALTQLEWLAGCAERLDVDGVAFALADFPRTDVEYAAQLKKVATDLSLVPVALDAPGLLDPDRPDAERSAAVTLASAVGAGLLRVTAGPPGDLPPQTFARTVTAAKALVGAAKAANVTVAVAPAAGSLIPGVTALRHLAKDVDSAWLRYELPAGAPDRGELGPRDRVLVETVTLERAAAVAAAGRAWFILAGEGGAEPFVALAAAVRALRLGGENRTPAEAGVVI
jgi:hypothetical protein